MIYCIRAKSSASVSTQGPKSEMLLRNKGRIKKFYSNFTQNLRVMLFVYVFFIVWFLL